MEIIRSRKGGEKIAHEGHLYNFEKLNADRTLKFWRCDKKYLDECRARLHTLVATGEVVKLVGFHTHGSDAAQIQVCRILEHIKSRAVETNENPSSILNNAFQQQGQAVLGKLPTNEALKRIIQRKRSATSAIPAQPTRLCDLVISSDVSQYVNTPDDIENFILYDSGEESTNRIIIFGKESYRRWAHMMKKLYVDSTFQIAPKLFNHVYLIMAERGNGFVFTVAYALLPNKLESTYLELFIALKAVWNELAPESVSCDFDIGQINAICTVFPEVQIHCSFFHLVRNMKKHLASKGLMSRYNNDPEFALSVREIIAMAYVPPERLEEAFAILIENAGELEPVLNWFEDLYLGRPNMGGGRRAALFPPSTWNLYERTLLGENRTNNFIKEAHRNMQIELGCKQPNIFKFIDSLKKLQAGTDKLYEEFVIGRESPSKKLKYKLADERIFNLINELDQNEGETIREFLTQIAHNFILN